MTKRLQILCDKTRSWFLTHLWARLALYALIAAALMLVYLCREGDGVAFLYSEF